MNSVDQERQFDVIIIGGSYAGLAAAMALGRALRRILVIDSGNPCNKQTPFSHNFLTNDGKTPGEIATIARQQVSMYDTVRILNAFVTRAEKNEVGFQVQLESGEYFAARKLVLASGIKDLMPQIPGIAECWGISVLHCPYCHGYEVRHEKTGILGNGDNGFELCSLISNWTNELTLFTNGESTLNEIQETKLKEHRIRIVQQEIQHLEHKNGHLESILFKDGSKTQLKALYTRLPFQQHSSIPESLGCNLTTDGYIEIDAAHRTTVNGVYACGDNTIRMRSVAIAVAMGTTAGIMVNKDLIEESL